MFIVDERKRIPGWRALLFDFDVLM